MSARRAAPEGERAEAAIWQDVEFGAYTADLGLWQELASDAERPVLELGAGSGRVALHLAERGHAVTGIELDPGLAAELERRAGERRLPVTVLRADIRRIGELDLSGPPALTLAPLHVVQTLEPGGRRELLAGLRRVMPRGGRLALTLVDESSLARVDRRAAPPPDMREAGGWVYASEPLWVQAAEGTLTVRRIRQRVSPGGEIERMVHDEVLHRVSPGGLEGEARAAELDPAGRRSIHAGPSEADSVAILLEAP